MESKQRILTFFTILLFIIIAGVIGYQMLLDLTFIDALYMTVITISTVGYAEVAPMTPDAKLFSILLIVISLGTVGYLFSQIVSYLMEGDIQKAFRRRSMDKRIAGFKDHYILCGVGETGWHAMKRLESKKVDFVVIDNHAPLIEEILESGVPAILGDATTDEVLLKAGIDRAKGLICALSKDADNVFIVLTARELNQDLYIVSRAIDKSSHAKLIRAGANNTLSPDEIGGNRMAALILRPSIVSFLDVITHAGDKVLDLEDIILKEGSPLINLTLREARLPEKTGLIVLAIQGNGDEKMQFNPSSNQMLGLGDKLMVLGTEEQVNKLKELSRDE